MFSCLAAPTVARTLYVSPAGNGVYGVYDPTTGKTAYVRDVHAYVQKIYKSRRVDGFGKAIDHSTFQKGSDPVAEAAQTTVRAVDSLAGTAYNAANMVPSWRRYTAPVKGLFGGNSR